MSSHAVEETPAAGPRRFDIRDVMILIVALTPGLITTATYFDGLSAAIRDHLIGVNDKFSTKNWSSLSWTAHRIGLPLANIAFMILTCLPPAQLLFRIRRPRPPSHLIAQQPGTVACLVMVLSASALLCLGVSGIISNSFRWAAGPGLSVVAIWSAMAATGRWLPERGWVDRLGIVLGLVGVATLPLIIWVEWK